MNRLGAIDIAVRRAQGADAVRGDLPVPIDPLFKGECTLLAHKRLGVWMIALLASGWGCGGGGGDGLGDALTDLTGPSGPSLVSWTDSANGSTVKDADNDALAFDTDGVMVRQDVSHPGVKVRSADATITWSGTVIGTVALVDSTSPGSKVATTLCVGGAPLNFTFLSDHVEYNCVTPQASSASNATSSGSTTRQGAGRSLVKWTGNSLEALIKDAENDYYVVDSGSRQLLFVGSQADGPQLINTPTCTPTARSTRRPT